MTKRTTTRNIAVLMAAAVLVLPAAARAADEPERPGLLSPDVLTAVWVIGVFVVLVAILYKTAWKNVLAGLNAREGRIRRDLSDAEAARVKGEASLVEYNQRLATAETQVRELLARATADAERIAATIRTKAQAETEEMKVRALKEIDTGRQQALAEIYEQTANLATGVAEKILRRNLNADDQKDLVSRSLEQLQNV